VRSWSMPRQPRSRRRPSWKRWPKKHWCRLHEQTISYSNTHVRQMMVLSVILNKVCIWGWLETNA
jgi:hypothetical protein